MASPATLIFRARFVYVDGAMREMVLWKLPQPTLQGPHGFRYRLHYNSADGRAGVRYDNEAGKDDPRHIDGQERRYQFQSVEVLLDDFLRVTERLRRSQNP